MSQAGVRERAMDEMCVGTPRAQRGGLEGWGQGGVGAPPLRKAQLGTWGTAKEFPTEGATQTGSVFGPGVQVLADHHTVT